MTFPALGEEVAYEGSLIRVVRATFEAPDGSRFEREVVRHPGAVVVVPLVDDDRVLAVRQFRAAVGREILELPAGKRDVDGEPPADTAAREMEEEVGRRAGNLELIGRFYNSPGFCDELAWLYLATDLEVVADSRQGYEETAMTVEEVRLDDLDRLVASGELIDAKSIIGLALANRRRRG